MTLEIWKSVVGYEGLYQVSDQGSVRSTPGTASLRKGVILSQAPMRNGYLTVRLSKKGIAKTYTVHTLVLTAFIGPRPIGMEARHFPSRDKTDNRLVNLSWTTPKQNQADRIIHGTNYWVNRKTPKSPPKIPKGRPRGINHPLSILSEVSVLEMRRLYQSGDWTLKQLGARFCCHFSSVSLIVNRKIWTHI